MTQFSKCPLVTLALVRRAAYEQPRAVWEPAGSSRERRRHRQPRPGHPYQKGGPAEVAAGSSPLFSAPHPRPRDLGPAKPPSPSPGRPALGARLGRDQKRRRQADTREHQTHPWGQHGPCFRKGDPETEQEPVTPCARNRFQTRYSASLTSPEENSRRRPLNSGIYCGSSGRIMEMISSVREAAELGPHPHLTGLGPIWYLGTSVRRKHHSGHPCGFSSAADWDNLSEGPKPPVGLGHNGTHT